LPRTPKTLSEPLFPVCQVRICAILGFFLCRPTH
jgi:hypothetical protein